MTSFGRIGRFEIIDSLGRGGMGVVYLARDTALGRTVAIKVLSAFEDGNDSEELRERFAREARSAAALTHPNIVTIYDVGEDNGRPFIAMEFVDGETMAELIRRRAPVLLDQRIEWVRQLCKGLGYAHRAGIIHRDIKPANLVITRAGILKILDFGLARLSAHTGAGLTRRGDLLGTPHYMAPEQIEGQPVDQRSDIFAVAAVLYELVTYRHAFPGESTAAVLNLILNGRPMPIRDLPAEYSGLEAIIAKGLSKSPEQRFQDLDDFLVALGFNRPAPGQSTDLTRRGDAAVPAGSVPDDAASRIEAHLAAALRYLELREYDAAIAESEQALHLEPANVHAIATLKKAHAARETERFGRWMSEAKARLARGDLSEAGSFLDQALILQPDSAEARALERELRATRRERERTAERARARMLALARARADLSNSAFESALRSATDALAYDPADAEAASLKAQALAALDRKQQSDEPHGVHGDVNRSRESTVQTEEAAESATDLTAVAESDADVSRIPAWTKETRRPWYRRPGIVGPLAVQIAVAIGVAIFARRDSPPPVSPLAQESVQPGEKQARALDDAESQLSQGRETAALSAVLAVLAAEPENRRATELLGRIRTGASNAAVQARQQALDAGVTGQPSFQQGDERRAAADRRLAPAETLDAVREYREAESLYHAAFSEGWTTAQFLARAQDERRQGRERGALDFAVRGIDKDPAHVGLRALITQIVNEAANAATTARNAAVEARAQATKSFSEGDARQREGIRLRSQPANAVRTVVAYREASALFARAPDEMTSLRNDRAVQLLNDASRMLEAGNLDEAKRLVERSLEETPLPAARTLKTTIDARLASDSEKARNADAEKRRDAEVSRALKEAASVAGQARVDKVEASSSGRSSINPPPTPPAPTSTEFKEVARKEIQRLREEFKRGYDQRSAAVIASVWPKAPTKALADTFEQLVSVDLRNESCDDLVLAADGLTARQSCDVTLTVQRRVGSPNPTPLKSSFEFVFANGSWIIGNASMVPRRR